METFFLYVCIASILWWEWGQMKINKSLGRLIELNHEEILELRKEIRK